MAKVNDNKLNKLNVGGVPENEYNKLKEMYGVKSSLDNYTVANALNGNKIEATNAGGDTTGLATPMANETATTQPTSQIDSYSQFLQESLDKQNANVEAQRANDLRQAQINYQLMMKYLPEQIKYSGLGNDGNSAQFYLNANNQLQNNLANINYNADQILNNNYANYYDKLASNQKELEQRNYEREQNKQESLYNIYNYLTEQIKDENGKIDQQAYNELLDVARKYGLSEDNINLIKAANDLDVYSDEETMATKYDVDSAMIDQVVAKAKDGDVISIEGTDDVYEMVNGKLQPSKKPKEEANWYVSKHNLMTKKQNQEAQVKADKSKLEKSLDKNINMIEKNSVSYKKMKDTIIEAILEGKITDGTIISFDNIDNIVYKNGEFEKGKAGIGQADITLKNYKSKLK